LTSALEAFIIVYTLEVITTMNGLTIEQLPETKDVDGAKRWDEERGEFVQISYRENIGHLAFFQIREGFNRGSHYHEKKEEVFYVVRGRIRATFRDLSNGETEEHILIRGQKIYVKPRCAHIFHGLEDTLVIEYSPQFYDKTDNYPADFTR
jgi:dTDP-4-dehydrorhamnose 3,5-epimerase-like enzyme